MTTTSGTPRPTPILAPRATIDVLDDVDAGAPWDEPVGTAIDGDGEEAVSCATDTFPWIHHQCPAFPSQALLGSLQLKTLVSFAQG